MHSSLGDLQNILCGRKQSLQLPVSICTPTCYYRNKGRMGTLCIARVQMWRWMYPKSKLIHTVCDLYVQGFIQDFLVVVGGGV